MLTRTPQAAALLGRARRTLAERGVKAAIGDAWDAANAALREDDHVTLAGVRALALELAEKAEGRTRGRAETLHRYCDHSLTDAWEFRRSSILGMLFPGGLPGRRRSCPACSARVGHDARFCPSCGIELDSGER